jgi:ABC-type transport system involved in multi-copper enzyme maturation permease subunit
MFKDIFIFELKYRFSRPATYIYFLILLIVPMLLVGFGNTPASEKVYHNAPIVIANLLLLVSMFGILIASAVMGVPLYRDLEHKTGTFLFSYPISETGYFMGRFWGSFVTLLFISLGAIIGFYLGSILGGSLFGTDPLRYGPNPLINYLQPWLTLLVPNLWLASGLFFALIVFTRNIRSIYSGGIIVFIVYLLANFLAQDIENQDLVEIMDPFGLNTFFFQTRYLTPFEQNSFLLPIEGNLLINRLLWIGVGLVFFLAAYFRFRFSYFFQTSQKKSKTEKVEEAKVGNTPVAVTTNFGKGYQWSSFKTLSKIEFQNIFKDIYFRSILLGGLIFLVLDFWIGLTNYSVTNFPVTTFLMEFKTFDWNLFVFIIIVFFTGETLHRDQSSGYSVINDAFPVKDWTVIASKFTGIAMICLMLTTIPIFVGIIIQTLKGYFQYEVGIYLVDSYLISLPDYLQMVMLVFAVHLVVNNKFAGHAAAIGIWLVMIILRDFAGYNFNAFFYSYKPGYTWSDMNGLGHFWEPLLWFNIYWTAIGLFLILFFATFYKRGTENNWKSRWNSAKSKMSNKTSLASYIFLVIGLICFGFIYRSTVYTNTYRTSDENELRAVAYETQLKKYEFMPTPKVISVNLKADMYPRRRDAYFEAAIQLVNKTDTPIDSIFFDGSGLTHYEVLHNGQELPYRSLIEFAPNQFRIFGKKESKPSYRMAGLPKTMMPGDTLPIVIKSEVINSGFPNSGFGRELVYNGSFIAGGLPSMGYDPDNELSSDEDRREHNLPEKPEDLPPHDDPYGVNNLLFVNDADLVQFEAVVSTSPDQMAIAPGYLQREWEEDGRRYFHYIQDTPIQMFFSVLSADYEVLRDKAVLTSGKEVDIEIYYQKGHEYNLNRFVESYQDGLKYFSDTYGDFQFRQMRILEFPRYAGFAQSFPNTVPYAESFGWVADFSDPNSFDYVYFVTAHELAHQWWAHQITPNYTRGSNLTSEALAEFSALILSERKYGKDNMKRFLRQELDNYLSGRSNESKKENTFINCNRPYQWYSKGALILYGLRDLIGPEAMDSALYKFNQDWGLKEEPPFPGSVDLYNYLAEATPDSLMYYLDDTWKRITLYNNKAEEVTASKVNDEEYDVTIKFTSQKLYADETGRETPAEYEGDYIDIGIFAEDDQDEDGKDRVNPLYVAKYKIKPGESSLTIRVKGEPAKAGIDPYNKLIDRIPDDNTVTVEIE